MRNAPQPTVALRATVPESENEQNAWNAEDEKIVIYCEYTNLTEVPSHMDGVQNAIIRFFSAYIVCSE